MSFLTGFLELINCRNGGWNSSQEVRDCPRGVQNPMFGAGDRLFEVRNSPLF